VSYFNIEFGQKEDIFTRLYPTYITGGMLIILKKILFFSKSLMGY